MSSPDFDAPSPISVDDTDDFKFEFSRPVFDDYLKLDIYLQADLSPMPSPDFDAPSPISDDDTDDFKLPDDGGDTTPTYTGPGGQDTPPLPSTPNRTGERKPNTAEFQGEQMSISEYLTKLAGQDQPNPASGTLTFFFLVTESIAVLRKYNNIGAFEQIFGSTT